MVKDREAWHAASPWGHDWPTEQQQTLPPRKKMDLVGAADQMFLGDFPGGLVVKTSPSTWRKKSLKKNLFSENFVGKGQLWKIQVKPNIL